LEAIKMKLNTNILIVTASVFTIITTANAQDFTGRFSNPDGKGLNLAMMGGSGGGIMGGGGMMGSRGIQDWFGSLGRDNRDRRDRWDLSGKNKRGNDYQNSSSTDDIETLRKQINAKRKELAALYRSDKTDKAIIDKKIDELSNLERDLDYKISSYDNR
jgi:Spy/CpxP family protein refolding chaperone